MSAKVVREEEVKAEFAANPALMTKTLVFIGLHFYLQGEARNREINEALKQKIRFLRKNMSNELLCSVDKEWLDGIGNGEALHE